MIGGRTPLVDGVMAIVAPGVTLSESAVFAAEPVRTGCADMVIPASVAADGSLRSPREWSPVAAIYDLASPPVLIVRADLAHGTSDAREVLLRNAGRARVALSPVPASIEPENFHVDDCQRTVRAGGPPRSALVSLIVPTRDHPELVAMAEKTASCAGWPRVEVIFVDNGTTDARALAALDRCVHRVVQAPIPFNFSRLVNRGAAASRGEFVVLLNNDVEALEDGWLDALLDPFADPGVGVVGSTLLYPSGAVQHCGIAIIDGIPCHPYAGDPERSLPAGLRCRPGERTAVTGACMAVRSSLWDFLGGMATPLATNYNDVDFCLRARRVGASVVCTPVPRMVHHESESRGLRSTPEVAADWLLFRSRWRDVLSEPDRWMSEA